MAQIRPGELDDIPFWVSFTTYSSYVVLFLFGYIRDGFRYFIPSQTCPSEKGYTPLLSDFDDFWTRRLYGRIRDAWNRPINSKPAATFQLLNGSVCLNLSSYNYLGFAENPETVNKDVHSSLDLYGLSSCSPVTELGSSKVVVELEERIAKFVGKSSSIVFGMGFATNSTSIPALFDKDTLLFSDHLNHSSLVNGCRQSGATIKIFKHNDYPRLETLIRRAVVAGKPRTHIRWGKIVILIEGIYSMEGEIVNLPAIVSIAKKQKCYIYVDEAHSMGALGGHGKGVCDHWGVDPADVDLLMGTFTKSFGSVGGYVAGSKDMIDCIRRGSAGTLYANSMSSVCAQQIISALKVITGEDGSDIGARKIRALRENSIFFRDSLINRGFQVSGSEASPVVIAMLYHPAKIIGFSRECLKRGLAVVVVGYPACPLIESRVRFCISAAHSKQQLEAALNIIDEVGEICAVKYNKRKLSRPDS